MKKFTTLFLASIFVASGLFAQKTPVMGVVDVERVLNDYTAFQAAVEKVRGAVAPVEEEMQKMQADLQNIVTQGRELETRANNPAASDEARAEAQAQVNQLQQRLQQGQAELQQFRQQAQQLAQRGQQEELAPLQEKAVEAVEMVATDKGIDIVLAKNSVIFAADSLEITDAVIAILNAAE
ncbi:MAG: OmpH family outer membrane protein [Puniceicoccaceae bacterium]|nr:MAG: OmpH family outer membrane protein [Puniceicoccaceae bacterium]